MEFFELENKSQLLALKSFKELKEKNKDYNKIMWFLYFVYDYYSYYFEVPERERIELIEKEFIGELGWAEKNKELLNPLIEVYNISQEGSARKFLRAYLDVLEKRRYYLSIVEYKEFNTKAIDDMLLNTAKIMEQEKEIRKKLSEKGEAIIKGNQSLSLLEKGTLRGIINS